MQARRREVIQRSFSKLLGEGRREGLIRSDTPVHLLIEILLGAVEAVINPPRLAELGLSPKCGFTAIVSVILEGALTPEGRRKLRPFHSQAYRSLAEWPCLQGVQHK